MPTTSIPGRAIQPKQLVVGASKARRSHLRAHSRMSSQIIARSRPAPSSRKIKARTPRNNGFKKKAAPKPAPKSPSVTPPMEVVVQDQLMPLASTNVPMWSSFCGHTNGVWQGRMAAFYAATGEAEAVSLVGKNLIYDLHTLVVEERPDDDLKLRRTLRSPDLARVRAANLEAADSREDVARVAAAAVEQGNGKAGDWEVEQILEEEGGLVFFDGGTFSRGPQCLLEESQLSTSDNGVLTHAEAEKADPQDEGALPLQPLEANIIDAAGTTDDNQEEIEDGDVLPSSPDYGEDDTRRKTSVIEQCLAWGGEQRLRLLLTISVGVLDGEMDLEVLRLVLWKETWQGLVSDCSGDSCIVPGMQNPAESATELSEGPRTSSKEFTGQWKAYDITAVPVEDEDPLTGEVKRINLYYSQETRQSWRSKKQGTDTDGAAIWLPNKALVEIQMIPTQSRGPKADSDEGMEEDDSGKGLLFTFSWAVKPDTIIGVHREYDPSGDLLECRNRSAVQGSWVGGSM